MFRAVEDCEHLFPCGLLGNPFLVLLTKERNISVAIYTPSFYIVILYLHSTLHNLMLKTTCRLKNNFIIKCDLSVL